MTGTIMATTPARSRQEVVDLIGFLGQSTRELARIDAEADKAAAAAKTEAEALAAPIRVAAAEAQAKVEAWFKVHPEAAALIPGAELFVVAPMDAQLTAVVLAAARPLTPRQHMILERLKGGMVLRRLHKHRSYSLIDPDRPKTSWLYVTSNHVFDLQHRYLDAHDAATGERLLGFSAFDARDLEFRIKPGVVLP